MTLILLVVTIARLPEGGVADEGAVYHREVVADQVHLDEARLDHPDLDGAVLGLGHMGSTLRGPPPLSKKHEICWDPIKC